MTNRKSQFRKLHRALAPIMALPLLITLITGSIYQITDLTGNEVPWLLDLHKGNFGIINLETVFPFLNASGLLFLVVTGISLWLQTRSKSVKYLG